MNDIRAELEELRKHVDALSKTTVTIDEDAVRILKVEGRVVTDTWISTKDSK
jgi:hypothetical protein